MVVGRLWKRLGQWERSLRGQYSHDITDPAERKKSRFFTLWLDHEILRIYWHNFKEIAPGVYRSNHPTSRRLERYAQMGIRTILNLRGASNSAQHKFEVEDCEKYGLELVNIKLSARSAPPKERLIETMDVLEAIEPPFLLHCKSGADRTGLVSAIYLMHVMGKTAEEGKKQLSPRFIHLKTTKTGVLDYFIRLYQRRIENGPISFRDWVEQEYDQDKVQEGFNATNFWDRLKL